MMTTTTYVYSCLQKQYCMASAVKKMLAWRSRNNGSKWQKTASNHMCFPFYFFIFVLFETKWKIWQKVVKTHPLFPVFLFFLFFYCCCCLLKKRNKIKCRSLTHKDSLFLSKFLKKNENSYVSRFRFYC